MRILLTATILAAALGSQLSAQSTDLEAGRASYLAGDFKGALRHFQLALLDNPDDAKSNYWVGRCYETLADIAEPFSARYASRARVYLARAIQLAPGRTEYRQELFAFLIDSAGPSREALREARRILLTVPASDPEYSYMAQRLQAAQKEHSSAGAWLACLYQAGPQTLMRIPGAIPSLWQHAELVLVEQK